MKILLHRLSIALIGISLFIAQPAQAKHLQSTDMEFLNSIFEVMPNLTACILMAKKNCTEVILDQQAVLHKLKGGAVIPTTGKTRTLDNADVSVSKKNTWSKAEIDLLLEYALTPIKEFFCHIKDRKSLITKLMEESFSDFTTTKSFEELNLMQFLNSDSNDLLEYFGKKSEHDQQVVIDFLLEIEHMFTDFKDSMNSHAIEAVKKHLITVNKKHQEKMNNKGKINNKEIGFIK